MKEWENYLAHGGLLEQIMEKVEKLFKTVHGIAPDEVDKDGDLAFKQGRRGGGDVHILDGEKCSECGGYRMGEYMMHNDGCSKSSTTTDSTPSIMGHPIIYTTEELKKALKEPIPSKHSLARCSVCGAFIDYDSKKKHIYTSEKEPTDVPLIKAMAGFQWIHDGKMYMTVEKADLEKIKRINEKDYEDHEEYAKQYLINEIIEKYLEEKK